MRNLVILMLLAVIAFGCNSEVKKENEALKAELAALAEENVALASADLDMAMEIETYHAMLTEIDENLASIDGKHKTVTDMANATDGEIDQDILLHLEHVHGTLANSKHKVSQMHANIDKLHQNENIDKAAIAELEADLDEATEEIFARDVAIEILNEEVVEQGMDIAYLAEAYEEQAAISDVLYQIITTAYVVIGSKKELEDYGIMEKEGGFLGMGRIKTLAADADNDWFTPVLINETDDIEVLCKKMKVITNHPESSYIISGDKVVEGITITDKAAFWDKSEYLVIQIVE